MTATARRRAGTRIDPIAAGWGGLTLAVGLMAGSPREMAERIAIVGVLSFIAGFLAGVRAIGRRIAHALAAWVVGVAIYVAFVAVTRIVDLFGGPDGAELLPDGMRTSLVALGVSLLAVLCGGALANSWLRPAGQGSGRYS